MIPGFLSRAFHLLIMSFQSWVEALSLGGSYVNKLKYLLLLIAISEKPV